MDPVGVVHVGSVAVALTLGAPGANPTVTSTEPSQPAAFFTHTLCKPLLIPVKAPLYGAYVPLSTLYSSPVVTDVTVMDPVGVVHVGSVAVALTLGAPGANPTVTSTEPSQPAAFFTHTLCKPLLIPVKAPLYGAYVPLSTLYSSPVVTDVTVMDPVGVVHVGSVAVAVTLGAPGADPTVTSTEPSQPAAFFTHTLCKPLLIPVKAPLYGAYVPLSTLYSSPVVTDVTVMDPVGVVHVGSVAVAVTLGAPGADPTVTSTEPSQPAAFFTHTLCKPLLIPVKAPLYGAYVPLSTLYSSPVVTDVTVMDPVGVVHVGSVAVAVTLGAPGADPTVTSTEPSQPAAFFTHTLCKPLLIPVKAPLYGAYVPLSTLYSSPVVTDVTVMDPVGVVHVGSVAVALTLGAPGANPTVTSTEPSQPAAFFTHTLCKPLLIPVKAPLYGAYVPLSTLYSSPVVTDVTVMDPVGVVHVGSVAVAVTLGAPGADPTVTSTEPSQPAAFFTHTLCKPLLIPVKAPLYGAYVPLSTLYSSPVVTDVTVMDPVGVVHVGSVAVAVTLGAPGADPTVTSTEPSQPAAFFTHTLCKPLLIPVKAPLYGAYVPLSTLYSSPVVTDVTVMDPVGVVHVGSVAVAVTLGAPGANPTVTSTEPSQPAAFFTHTLCKPLLIPVKAPLYGAYVPLSTLYSSPVVTDVTVMDPVGVVHVGSVAVAVTLGAPGADPTVTSTEDSQPAAFFTHTLCKPLLIPVKAPLYGAYVLSFILFSEP